MDRRRLERAHLIFAVLTVVKDYPSVFNLRNISFSTDIQDTLLELAPLYYSAFKTKYGSKFSINNNILNISGHVN